MALQLSLEIIRKGNSTFMREEWPPWIRSKIRVTAIFPISSRGDMYTGEHGGSELYIFNIVQPHNRDIIGNTDSLA